MFGSPVSKKIFRSLEAEYDIEQIKPGQIVSIHWGVPCEIITEEQAKKLKKYTQLSIDFANQTL
jgi:hydrogenase maturation factor